MLDCLAGSGRSARQGVTWRRPAMRPAAGPCRIVAPENRPVHLPSALGQRSGRLAQSRRVQWPGACPELRPNPRCRTLFPIANRIAGPGRLCANRSVACTLRPHDKHTSDPPCCHRTGADFSMNKKTALGRSVSTSVVWVYDKCWYNALPLFNARRHPPCPTIPAPRAEHTAQPEYGSPGAACS